MTETRVTDPNTGGQKGKKLAQLGALDPEALLKVAEVAGFGAGKYARYNFLKGYDWSLSFDAMMRHALAFWSGVDIDEESGLPHLAHAAWQALALLAFHLHQVGTDDRPHSAPTAIVEFDKTLTAEQVNECRRHFVEHYNACSPYVVAPDGEVT